MILLRIIIDRDRKGCADLILPPVSSPYGATVIVFGKYTVFMERTGNVVSNGIKTITCHERENGDLDRCDLRRQPHYCAFFTICCVFIVCLFQYGIAHPINPI